MWIVGSLLSKGFINTSKTWATIATKCIKISTHSSERYPWISLYLSVEAIPFQPFHQIWEVSESVSKILFQTMKIAQQVSLQLHQGWSIESNSISPDTLIIHLLLLTLCKILSPTSTIFQKEKKVNSHLININNAIYFFR